jgi:hypothetical protein
LIRGAAAQHLSPHALAPVAELPVLEIVFGIHILANLTLGLGKVVHDYLQQPVRSREKISGHLKGTFDVPATVQSEVVLSNSWQPIAALSFHQRRMVSARTVGPEGLDCSPRCGFFLRLSVSKS